MVIEVAWYVLIVMPSSSSQVYLYLFIDDGHLVVVAVVVQAKDDMRLSGVTRTCPLLIARVAVGGSATSWVVQEFSAQMRAVCKIALHRQQNLASFLEQHGMYVLAITSLS